MIDRATIDKITAAADIVDVVSEFVNLRRAGANYKGLCPFHDDKTPSFMVSPAKNICHCFACGKGGTPVSFIMEHEQMTYPEALRWLARRYHIEVKERELSAEERREESDRESMYVVNEWAKGYFQSVLANEPDGRALGMQYFRSRGIRDDIITKFGLGYALPRRDALSQAALKAGYNADYLVKTGLCYKKDNGELVDRYAGRVIFPWLNVSGKVSAFGGRLLDARTKGVQQKYVNSPESDIFHKDRELYGLYQAKRAVTKANDVYMVEGYMDVIAMHQCGVENVVANSGTALSVSQIKLLHRFTTNICLLYDGDAAGIHAAMRGTDMLLAEGMNIKVIVIPDDDDPDSYARKHGAEALRTYIEQNRKDFIQFKSDMLLRGVTDPVKRSEAIASIVKSISVIPDQITRDTYLHESAARIGMSESTLVISMNKFIREAKRLREARARRGQEATMQASSGGAGEQAASSGGAGEPAPATAPAAPMASVAPAPRSNGDTLTDVESMLIQVVIRDGETVLYDDLDPADGYGTTMSVAQYVKYDLASDNLRFDNDIYNTILDEAAAHSGDDGFKAADYFTRHPDIAVSRIAATLAVDHYRLSRSLVMEQSREMLERKVRHLILDFRAAVVTRRLDDVKRRLRGARSNEEVHALMREQQALQTLRNKIACSVGRS